MSTTKVIIINYFIAIYVSCIWIVHNPYVTVNFENLHIISANIVILGTVILLGITFKSLMHD